MDFIIDLITNPYLLTGLGAWFVAQVLKTIIYAVINKKIVWERMIGDGGMPSGHSATVTSMAVFAALRCGANSYEFAIAGILAVIVCHDAMGVRLETGKQAEVILELLEAFAKLTEDEVPAQKLKTFVGHTPVQVVAGIALGVLVAFGMNMIL